MRRQIFLGAGWVLLFSGWLSAFWLNGANPDSTAYYLIPAFLLGIGMGLIRKVASGKIMVVSLAFSAVLAIALYNRFEPQRPISFSEFQQRIKKASLNDIPLLVSPQVLEQAPELGQQVLKSPAKIVVSVFARLPAAGRNLAFDDQGNLYVSIPELGAIYQLRNADQDDFADGQVLYQYGLDRPTGLTWHQGKLYVATPAQVLELTDLDGDSVADETQSLVSGLPDDGGYWQRGLVAGSSDALYLSIGSRCNLCDEKDSLRATIQRLTLASGTLTPYASGLRNTTGLATAPDTQQLWAAENGTQGEGRDVRPDEINRISQGKNFGWPHCYAQQQPETRIEQTVSCRNSEPSAVDLPPRSGVAGIAFGDGLNAPQEYRDSLFVIMRGNESLQPQVVRIDYQQGRLEDFGRDFLSGWRVNDVEWGAPADLQVGPDGNLYMSDEKSGVIYRIHWLQESAL